MPTRPTPSGPAETVQARVRQHMELPEHEVACVNARLIELMEEGMTVIPMYRIVHMERTDEWCVVANIDDFYANYARVQRGRGTIISEEAFSVSIAQCASERYYCVGLLAHFRRRHLHAIIQRTELVLTPLPPAGAAHTEGTSIFASLKALFQSPASQAAAPAPKRRSAASHFYVNRSDLIVTEYLISVDLGLSHLKKIEAEMAPSPSYPPPPPPPPPVATGPAVVPLPAAAASPPPTAAATTTTTTTTPVSSPLPRDISYHRSRSIVAMREPVPPPAVAPQPTLLANGLVRLPTQPMPPEELRDEDALRSFMGDDTRRLYDTLISPRSPGDGMEVIGLADAPPTTPATLQASSSSSSSVSSISSSSSSSSSEKAGETTKEPSPLAVRRTSEQAPLLVRSQSDGTIPSLTRTSRASLVPDDPIHKEGEEEEDEGGAPRRALLLGKLGENPLHAPTSSSLTGRRASSAHIVVAKRTSTAAPASPPSRSMRRSTSAGSVHKK